MLRSIFSIVLMQLCFWVAYTQSFAATYTVRQDGTGDATTLAGAIALATDGDTIDIQQFTTDFDETGTFIVTGLTFTSTAATKPVIKSSTASYIFQEATNCSFENIHFVGQSSWQMGLRLFGTFSVSHCDLTGFSVANPIALVCQSNKPVLQGTVENCFITGGGNQMIAFDFWYDDGSGVPAPTTADLGPILFNHCTIINNDNFQFAFTAGFPGDLSNVTVRNSIIGAVVSGAVSNSSAFLPNRTSDCNIVHEYNCYLQTWWLFYNITGSAPGATEVSGSPIDPFKDMANGDYNLSPSGAATACLGTGSDGLNMGADVTTTKEPLTIAVRQDGTGDATTIAGAIALASEGDIIDIQQFTTDFDETGSFNVTGLTFTSSTSDTLPVIKSSTAPYLFVEATNCSFENIHFVGQSFWQVGLRLMGAFNISHCTFTDFAGGNPFGFVCQSNKPVLQGTVEYSYITCPINEMITFDCWYDTGLGVPAPTTDNLGPIVLNHCTIVNNNNFQLRFASDFPGDLSNVTVRNSILGAVSGGAIMNAAVFLVNRAADANIVHEYNCYLQQWALIYGTGGIELGAVDSTELVGAGGAALDPFADLAGGDYRLMENTSPCLWAASDGQHIGADQDTTPVTLSDLVLE